MHFIEAKMWIYLFRTLISEICIIYGFQHETQLKGAMFAWFKLRRYVVTAEPLGELLKFYQKCTQNYFLKWPVGFCREFLCPRFIDIPEHVEMVPIVN